MDSERTWVLIEGSIHVAICSVYLRTEHPVGSVFYEQNVALLSVIQADAQSFREKGFHLQKAYGL